MATPKKRVSRPRKTPMITSGAIRRLCILAGVERITPKAVDQMKKIIMVRMEHLIKNAVALAELARRHTLKFDDLVFLHKVYGGSEAKPTKGELTLCKNSKELKKKVHNGTAGKCLVMMSNTSFGLLVKPMLKAHNKFIDRMSREFKLHMQNFIEMQAVRLLIAADDAAIDIAGRKTVFLKDINFVEAHGCTAVSGRVKLIKASKKKKTKKSKKATRTAAKKKSGRSTVY